MHNNNNIQKRFIKTIVILLLSFFLLLITGTYVIELYRIGNDVNKDLKKEANNSLEKIELRLSYIIQGLENFANSSLAINSLIDTSGRTSYLPQAIEELARTDEIQTVIMFDFSGKPIESNINTMPDWFKLENFRAAISVAKNHIIFDKNTGSFLITIPISYYNTPQGGIITEVKFNNILHKILSNDSYYYKLISGNDWHYINRETSDNLITTQAQPSVKSLLYPFDLILKISQSRATAMQPVLSTIYEILLIGLAGIILATITAAQVGKKLAKPIITLTERVRNDIHPCGPIGTNDELEILAKTFDENTKNLLTAKNELETRVELRTAQLQEKTQQLQKQHKELENANKSLNDVNKELQYLDKLKDEFISTVSHELRTPLTSIRGTLGLIEGGAIDNDPDKKHELLSVAVKNSERLSQLISDLLDMQKFAAGKIELELSEVSINKLLHESVISSQGYADTYGIKLIYEPSKSDYIIQADQHRLRQVMDNLISNAVKYSPKDSHVDIFTTQHNQSIKICVRDYGEGIPESQRSRIFEKFTQVDSTDKRAKSGTGLGLSICKDILKVHNGSIDFENMPDGGTLFWFELQYITKLESPNVSQG